MPLLGAMANAGTEEETRVRALVRDIAGHPEHRDEVVAFVKSNGGLEYAVAELDKYVSRAVDALGVLPDSYEKTCLIELAHFTARRKK
jgi:octaprenyl-diphosphate synthase